MSNSEKINHGINQWPGISKEDEVYIEENARMISEKGGEDLVTEEDDEVIEKRVRARLLEEGEDV